MCDRHRHAAGCDPDSDIAGDEAADAGYWHVVHCAGGLEIRRPAVGHGQRQFVVVTAGQAGFEICGTGALGLARAGHEGCVDVRAYAVQIWPMS